MAKSIEGLQGTLVMGSWSSKKRKHLAAAVLLVEGKPYPTIVHDNSSVTKLVRFLQERVLSRPCANKNQRNNDGDDDDGDEDHNQNNGQGDDVEQGQISPLTYNTVRGYKMALTDLWSYQSFWPTEGD
ncbi:hypothetical protein MMC22_005701 [Lobaria immixta]|nr:hypothetical protein [Lobaria immixta]